MASGGDQAGDVASLESGVDVDDGDVARATIEHAQQRCQSLKIGSLADAGGDADHGAGDVTADDAGERTLHSSDDDNRIGIGKFGEPLG